MDEKNILEEQFEEKSPSIFMQSALFGINETRRIVKNYPIPSLGDNQIFFTGELLNQFDFDVFQAMIELAYENESNSYTFKFSQVCNIMNKENQTETRNAIKASLIRLSQSHITIKNKKVNFFGSLFNTYEHILETDQNKLDINTKTLDMFSNSSYYDKEIREQLKGNLTKFYYMFFCSHKNVFELNLETYLELSDSSSLLKDFKRRSIKSFNEIFTITEEKIAPSIIKSNGKDKVVVIKK
jgi:hypothetical protein